MPAMGTAPCMFGAVGRHRDGWIYVAKLGWRERAGALGESISCVRMCCVLESEEEEGKDYGTWVPP